MKNNQDIYEVENYGLSCACENQEQGLGGWFASLWQGVKRGASAFGFIGMLLAGAMDMIDGACKMDWSMCKAMARDYVLTDAETVQVTEWANKYFSPFYNNVIDKLNGIFIPGTTLEAQLKLINEASTKMALFKAYLETNPNNFSVNANKEQFNGVTEFFGYLNKVIYDIIMESEVLLTQESIKVSSSGIDFAPFQVPLSSTMADLWKVANGGIVPQTVTLQPTASQIQTITQAGTVSTTTVPTTPTETKSMPGIVKFGIAAALSYGVYKLLTKKSK